MSLNNPAFLSIFTGEIPKSHWWCWRLSEEDEGGARPNGWSQHSRNKMIIWIFNSLLVIFGADLLSGQCSPEVLFKYPAYPPYCYIIPFTLLMYACNVCIVYISPFLLLFQGLEVNSQSILLILILSQPHYTEVIMCVCGSCDFSYIFLCSCCTS